MTDLVRLGVRCLALWFALFSVVGVGHAAAQPNTPAAVARAFMDAYRNGDVARMRELVDPTFVALPDPRDPGGHPEDFVGFVKNHLVHVSGSNIRETGPTTAVADVVFSGPEFRPLPHPFTEQVTFTVINGRITRIQERVSAQTFADLQALGPMPGMPATGAREIAGLWVLLVAGGLCFGAGLLVRRLHATNS